MPIGSPDFSQNLSTNPTAPSYDQGEETTRLLMGGGSSARSGRWIFATGFEEGATPYLNLSVSPSGSNAFVGLHNAFTYQGLACLRLQPHYVSGSNAYLVKGFVYPSTVYGFEFQISIQGTNQETEVMIYSYGYANSNFVIKYCRILIQSVSAGNANLYYYTDSTNKTLIKSGVAVGTTFRIFKVVWDSQNNIIKRLYFGSQFFDLNVPGYSIPVSPFLSESVVLQIKVTNKNDFENQNSLIDNLIVTADEP